LGFSQVKITGTVLNMTDTKPIAAASVFLSNTTTGTETAGDGTFTLVVKPGKYDLIVTVVGYEIYQQPILVSEKDIHLPVINMVSTTTLLKSVTIKPDNAWYRLYQDFKAEFLGTSPYARTCKILNPDSLDLNYDPSTRQLMAKSRGFLIIANKALGYRIKYQLIRFVKDYKDQAMVYKGYALFEEMKGSPEEEFTWKKNRLDCYNGSAMHFLRSVITDKVAIEGFEVHKIYQTLNPKPLFPPSNDGLVRVDAVQKYRNRYVDTVLDRLYYFDETQKKGIYVLDCPYSLCIAYKKRLDYQQDRKRIYTQFNLPNYETTIATFTQEPDSAGIPKDTIMVAYPRLWAFKRVLKKPYAFFDDNGVLTDPLSLSYDGYWAFMREAEALPFDYDPPVSSN
jgi:hypothetical protein